MRISDWSSDVCSSDLGGDRVVDRRQVLAQVVGAQRIAHAARSRSIDIGHRRVEERRAVLGDVQGDVAVGLLEPQQQFGQALRAYLPARLGVRAEEHTSELQSLMRNSYAVFCLKKKTNKSHELNTPYQK